MNNLRMMSVAGSFYPSNPQEIVEYINHFNTILQSHPEVLKFYDSLEGNSVIVPHAGWVYSGFTANIAFRILKRSAPKTVVVIGPSHRIGFEGISIADMDAYQTPLGNLPMNLLLVKELKKEFNLITYQAAHHEHSTEVQMPFVRYYLPECQVIEMVYSLTDVQSLAKIIDYLVTKDETAIVISTDLSHYYMLDKAKELDSICIEAIRTKHTSQLHQGCEACGKIGVEAILDVAKMRGWSSTLLDYRTSADASGDKSRVVGYASALFRL